MPHREVTDEEYLEALPPNGLALAESQLRETVDRSQADEDFPGRDAVVGLAFIRSLRQSEDDEDSA
jgi:hypothetical protein